MAKKPTRLKKLRLTELSLVSAGANQHSSIGIFKAAEPEPEPETVPITMTPEQRERANAWAAEYLKTMKQNQELTKMNEPKTTADIVKAYQDRHDVDYNTAFSAVVNRPEFAAAYDAENRSGHIQRQIDQRIRTYGE